MTTTFIYKNIDTFLFMKGRNTCMRERERERESRSGTAKETLGSDTYLVSLVSSCFVHRRLIHDSLTTLGPPPNPE